MSGHVEHVCVRDAGGVALLSYRVGSETRTLVDLRIEKVPFPLPG